MATPEDLTTLVVNLPNASILTAQMKLDALAGARIPDQFGVWPGQPGYVETHDLYFAAIGLIGFLQAQPVIRQSSSEGTSVAVDAPNWSGLVAWYRSMSAIARVSPSDVLNRITIPDVPHVRRISMTYGGDSNDNVDTDLS